MEAGYNEEKFKQHIKTVVQAAEGNNSLEERPLTLGELRELAISMGMSDTEWEELQASAVIHLETAQRHLDARNFNEAIADAEKATAINPYLANGNSVLAKSYQMLWLEDNDIKAREKAEYYARRELIVDPTDQVCINILSTINKKSKIGAKDEKSKKLYFIVGGIIVFLLLFFYFSAGSSGGESSTENELIVAQEEMYSKYDLVQTAIDQRNNMLPDLFSSIGGNNRELSQLNAAIKSLSEELKTAEGANRYRIETEIDDKIKAAKKIATQSGSSESIATVLNNIEGAENRIAYEKKSYNDAVKAYNIIIKQNKGDFDDYEIQPYYNEQ